MDFQIRVALVGYVSVGKSTVINALLGDKYSEVNMRRTTAGVNYFRVSQKASTTAVELAPVTSTAESSSTTTTTTTSSSKSAEETHAEISKDNETLRSAVIPGSNNIIDVDMDVDLEEEEESSAGAAATGGGGDVVEKFFDIKVDEAICDMRNDTKLVLIDIPGINEADSSKKYKDYVSSKWDSFDCVVVVMDAMAGVNTLEQVELLKFVQHNNTNLKRIPTIVLGNKVDEPNDVDTLTLVGETREKTIEIFGQGCTEKSLKSLLDAANNGDFYRAGGAGAGKSSEQTSTKKSKKKKNKSNDADDDHGAVFIPVSAKNAFIYRKAVHLSVDTFEGKNGSSDQDLFDKIGKDEVGRRWNKMSSEEKVEVISSIINDPDEYKERLAGTNFHNFLAVVKYFIGGNDTQQTLLSNQIEIALKSLTADDKNDDNVSGGGGGGGIISENIHNVYKKCTAAGRSTDDLPDKFWDLYDQCEEASFLILEEVVDPSVLQRPFIELEKFYELCGILDWKDEQTTARQRMKEFLSKQFDLVIRNEKAWTFETFYDIARRGGTSGEGIEERSGKKKRRRASHNGRIDLSGWKASPKVVTWETLSPMDFEAIFSSVLLPSCEYEFYSKFGKQKVMFEELLFQYRLNYDAKSIDHDLRGDLSSVINDYIETVLLFGDNEEEDDAKGAIVKVAMPEDLSDPSHWGYIAFKYIAFCHSHNSKD
jgi:GTPase SAR1 family protein